MRTTVFQDEKVRPITFHFNKGHLKDSNIPMWVIKYKGETHYVHHVTVSEGIGLSTRETPEHPTTKGSLRFKGSLTITTDDNGKLMAEIC